MDVRNSLSRLKEKLKLKSRGGKLKQDSAGPGTDGEGIDPAGSLPLPVPYAVAGGSDVDGRQVRSTDRLPQPGKPEFASNDQEREEEDHVYGGEVSQRHSNPRQAVEVAVSGGPGREGHDSDVAVVERGHPTPSIPSILHSGKPDGM